jgi:hypothetical protein
MGKVKQVFVDLEHEGPDQEEDGPREASSPVVLIVLCMVGSAVATWAGVAAGRF